MAHDLLRLCGIGEIGEDAPSRVEIAGFGYAVSRVGEEFFVTANLCSHGPGSLAEGFLDGYEVECPFHGGRFDIRTGEATAAPCSEPILVWGAIVKDDAVFIDPSATRAAACPER